MKKILPWWIAAAMVGSLVVSGDAEAKKDKDKKNRQKVERKHRADRANRPPGWDRGQKRGWGGSDVPPGLSRNRDRDRDRFDDDRDRFDDRDRNRDRYDERRRDRDRNVSRQTTYTARVVDSTGRLSRAIALRLNNGVTRRLSIPERIRIYRSGRLISVHDLREGDVVRVTSTRIPQGWRIDRMDVIN